MKLKKHTITAIICTLVLAFLCGFSGNIFLGIRELEELYPSEHLTEVKMLSEYFPDLKGTNGDTEVYIFRGEEEGGSCLVLGGTHGNEIGSYMAGIVLLENVNVNKGTLYVIPRTNRSGLTCNDPGDAAPDRIHIETKSGTRWFKYGSRATNPIDQWPDPDAYVHAASGQNLSGSEIRNINRAYPGRADGTFTEKIAYGIAEMIRAEQIDMTIDLHEASPEYPNIDSTVAHERAMSVASNGMMSMLMKGIKIKLEPSPQNLHGLTHRELGDYTDTMAILMETANACQGRIRGATNEHLAITGKDKCYETLEKYGLLYVPYDETGHPLEERAGRHLQGIQEYIAAMSKVYPDKAMEITNIPTYEELMNGQIGDYLN